MSEEFSNVADAGGDFSSSPEPSSYEPQPSYGEAPQSWSRDISERHWRALPDDLRGYVHSREKEAYGKITEQGHRIAELNGLASRYQPVNDVFERYRQHIPEGLEPAPFAPA